MNHPLRPRDDLGGIGFTSRPSDDTIFWSDPEKRCALGKFGLLQVGKYSKGGSNPRFLIDLATFDEKNKCVFEVVEVQKSDVHVIIKISDQVGNKIKKTRSCEVNRTS